LPTGYPPNSGPNGGRHEHLQTNAAFGLPTGAAPAPTPIGMMGLSNGEKIEHGFAGVESSL
jgi:hypothetical protein